MNRYFKTGLLLLAVLSLTCCKDEIIEEGSYPENEVSFTIGNDATVTKASTSSGEIQVASYAIEGVEDNDLVLVETVSNADNLYYTDVVETKGTPVYTENFDALYGEQVYATAFVPKTGTVELLTEPWGIDFGNNGTVKLTKTAANTYSYNYSDQSATHVDWNLHWPDGGKLLYFIQAPYNTTNALNPDFYSDGSIQFDYTDPTTPSDVDGRQTIVNGASAQKDILFTSKTISDPGDGSRKCQANILMYHALTAVKFKAGNVDVTTETVINSITFKSIKANGHCTITSNYDDENTSAGKNSSNIGGDAATKSSKCSSWTSQATDLVVDYTQNFSGKTDYTAENSSFASSFYNGTTAEKNLINAADGGEVMLMVPQTLSDVEVVVDFSLYASNTHVLLGNYTRSVKLSSSWKAGELHTYTLTVNKVAVNVTDEMSYDLTQKKNLSMTNTGNVVEYLRATFALAWYYGDGNDAICVAAYQGDGGFITGSDTGISSRWIKGSDGFYYYPYPIMPGKDPQFVLFNYYNAPVVSQHGPFPGSHLEMNILVQGVQYDEVKEKVGAAWKDVYTVDEEGNPTSTTIVSQLSTTIENKNW